MFKPSKIKPSFSSILTATLLVLLTVLATLQYRWLGRVSTGEREAIRASLQTKTRDFCQAFDREITHAYAVFKMNADTFRHGSRNGFYAERLDRWTKTSAYPGIVKGIFLVESGDNGIDGKLRLLRFSETAKAFEAVEWTPDLESLRNSFEQQRQNADSSPKGLYSGGADSVVEEVPALVSSVVSVRAIDAKSNRAKVDWLHPLGYVIVALDLDYIKKEFFPGLAKTYFSSGETIDYDLNITSRVQPQNLIYQSNSESKTATDSFVTADVKDKLFNIGFDQVKSYSSERVYNNANSSNQDKPNFTLVVPALKDDEKAAQEESVSKVLLVDDSAKWELKVNHRLGSLDAAVTNARRWNLATSFGILLLLGGSVVLIAALSRRSQKLARRQIEFVAGVSHEFRTPLAVIHSLSENLAAGRIKDSLQVERYGATIHKDVRRLTEMVEQVLEFAGAERSGKYFYDKSPVDIANIIERVIAANFSPPEKSGWKIEKEIEPDLPRVFADEAAIERTIQNIVGNAMKYSDGSRWLKITAYKSANKSEVIISVEDKGIGIPPSELSHIFEPFFRGREAVSAQIHGNGIGLSLVKQIIEAHGGRVSVNSSRGENGRSRGSTFNVYLPTGSE